MNTKGHEKVAQIAGIPLLEGAFGKDDKSIRAFHLGNWLTDVSQAVDPLAYRKFAGKGKKVTNFIFDVLEWLIEKLYMKKDERDLILKSLLQKRAAVNNTIEIFLVATNGRQSQLEALFRSAFLVIGYFKFVHPEYFGQQPRMNYDCFIEVFGRDPIRGPEDDRPGSYTQYYPHEHLDRPETLPSKDPPVYAFVQTSSTKRTKENLMPHMYNYLWHDIQMTAGLLAEVDLEFETAFSKGKKEDDPQWHLTLAKLGHALHQVEDFFAHSNWIELALVSRKHLLSEALPDPIKDPFAKFVFDRPNDIVMKRLKRYTPQSSEWATLFNWKKHPNEKLVVTGYFDFLDTLVSLLHITENLWGADVADPYMQITEVKKKVTNPTKTVSEYVQKLSKDTLDFTTDPQKALADPENDVAKKLKPYEEEISKKLFRPGVSKEESDRLYRDIGIQVVYDNIGLFQGKPEIQYAFLNMVIEGSRIYTFNKVSISLYRLIKEVTSLIANPIGYIVQFLRKYVKDFVIEKIQQVAKYYSKELVYDLLAQRRIGCHSLLAKDHEHAILYEQQEKCAIAIHWYIVKTLTRWKDSVSTNMGNKPYVDWLELLEHFLRNPNPSDRKTIWIFPVMNDGWKVFKGYYDEKNKYIPPFTSHELKMIDRGNLNSIISNGKSLRRIYRSAYS